VYGIGILIFRYLPYYQKLLNPKTQRVLLLLYLGYLIVSPFYYFFFSKGSTNKSYIFLKSWKRFLFSSEKLSKEGKVAALFMLVKIFYIPLMLNFFIQNLGHLSTRLAWYPFAISLIFTLDTGIFAFGYLFESRKLKNVVRSVEPTIFGWAVALISYPPFNSFTGKYIAWGANDYVAFWTPALTGVMRIVIIVLLGIYLWATFALGPKASNLTNRGIVSKFPYSIVRHPAYIAKNTVWWLTILPVINWKFALGMFFWSVIYYFRAITEEKHLSQDPDYIEYKRKIKWKFIPGLW